MEITAFEWDEWNDEAEQCFFNLPQWHKRKRGNANTQERFYLVGSTDSGRLLLVVYQRKPGGVIRIITAYSTLKKYAIPVIPAGAQRKAGIHHIIASFLLHSIGKVAQKQWIPAFAGMTVIVGITIRYF